MKNNSILTSENKARLAFRSGLQGVKEKMVFFIESRTWLPHTLFEESLGWLYRQPKLSSAYHNPFPNLIGELGIYMPHKPISYKREIEWAKAFIKTFKNRVQEYLHLRERVQEFTLLGRFDDALTVTSEIKKRFGVSFWWIKHTVALNQLNQGIEAQKKLSNELKQNFSLKSNTRYIIHQISIKNEPSVTPSRFVSQVNEEIAGFPMTDDWKQKLIYHVIGGEQSSFENALQVLRLSTADSLIDTYEAYINLLQVASISDIDEQRSEVLIKSLIEINASINDKRTDSLLFSLTSGTHGAPRKENIEVLKSFINNTTLLEQESIIAFQRLSIGNYVLAAMNNIHGHDTTSLAFRISDYLYSIFAKSKETDISATEIERLALIFPGLEVIKSIWAIAKCELQSSPIYNDFFNFGYDKGQSESSQRYLKFALSSSLSIHPSLFRYLPSHTAHRLALFAYKTGDLDQIIFPFFESNGSGAFYTKEELYTISTDHLNRRDYNKCISSAHQMFDNGTSYYEMSATRIIIHAMMAQAKYSESIQLATSCFLANNEAVHILPIAKLADGVDKQLRREMKSDLSLAILFDIYARHIDSAYESVLRISVTAALIGNGVKRPSELINKIHQFDRCKLIYFLKYACLPEIIYMTGDYEEGTSSLLEERIKILKWLIDLDPENITAYDGEIVDYTRKIVLQAKRIEVEKSKIEYNLDGLVREAEKTTKENYDRYIAYLNAGIEQKLVTPASIGSAKSGVPLLPIALPVNEVSELLKSIVKDLNDIFVKDRNYGMDGFLSTRIRHNELESEMLSSVIALKLVTTRDAEGHYEFNEHWLGEISSMDYTRANHLQDQLNLFANAYDSLIKEINEQWVRISRSQNDTGLININIDAIQYDFYTFLSDLIKERRLSFIEFSELLFHTFFGMLEIGLNAIREKLNSEAKERIFNMIDALELEIVNDGNSPTSLLNSVRELRVSVPRSIDKIISWLKPSKENSNEPLQFGYTLQIAIDMAKHYNPGFNASLDLGDTEACLVPGLYVSVYTHIFMMLFQNVIRRAGLGNAPFVTIACKVSNGNLQCFLRNKIGPEIDIAQISYKVANILTACADGSYRDRMRGESGTGLFRIFDAINNIMKVDPKLEITAGQDRTFEIGFQLPQENKGT